MQKQLAQMKDFHDKFFSLWRETPGFVDDDVRAIRIHLMREELEEAVEAMEKEEDIADVAKELADVLYTVYGTIGAYGLADKMEAIFNEVHASNMSKDLPEEIEEPRNVKAVKGTSYKEADVAKVINS